MKLKLKFALILVALSGGSQMRAADVFDFGSAPEGIVAATPKNTELGQKALSYFNDDYFSQGRILFNSRLRFEHVDTTGLSSANAVTLRTRIGYETPKYYGIYGAAEFENTWSLNSGDYRQYPGDPTPAGGAVIPDPRNNELNQLYLGYSGFNSDLKGGRQIINLDNQRFVGAVAWRQNDQTFDAVRLTTEVVQDFWLSYAYNWQVNRIFGDSVTPPNSNFRRFDSQNHFVNVHYTGLPVGELGAYFYYLDLGGGTAAISGNTAGLFYDGAVKIDDDWSVPFRAEYAYQFGNGQGPNFSANYFHLFGAAKYQKYQLGIGFESLGSAGGGRAFQTPLATLHKFNGWADVFLTTPPAGLRDYYVSLSAGLPEGFGLSGAFHYFTGESSAMQYGTELDFGVSYQFNENLTGLVKLGSYWGASNTSPGAAATQRDVLKCWVQLDFKL